MATSSQLVCLEDFRSQALKLLSSEVADYLESGSGYEHTLRENRQAYNRYIIRPRYLVDVSNIDTSVSILGRIIPSPICVAPTSYGTLFHPDGDVAIAKACAKLGTVFSMSFSSPSTVDEIHAASGDGLNFYQILWRPTRQANCIILRIIERFRFHALMVSMDCPVASSCRWKDERNCFEYPSDMRMDLLTKGEDTGADSDSQIYQNGAVTKQQAVISSQFTWEDLQWLVSETQLPVVARGILTGEAAARAVNCGVAAVMVSNHGGRRMDGLPATIDVLPEIVKAVAGRCEIYMDGGIRTGTDVFKALARGAKAVFLGRPVVYALAVNGEEGVCDMMGIIRKEFRDTMTLAGCQSLSDIGQGSVVHETFYHN